ncbi:MAG: PKD domain-containing protein [Bacteroidia bacterium]
MKKPLLLLFLFFIVQRTTLLACNANFTHTYACAGDTVFFEALDQAAVYTWDFGDTASGVANISHDTDSYHIFVNPGTYYVTLFVNIGAEWDYKTQILHIGTDCFNADFSELCGGNKDFNFTNESTGAYTSVLWNFGDPSTGTSDTSTSVNAYHAYSTTGTYTVTLIISDGTQSDTLIRQVTVQPTCLTATFYNFLGGDCVQNTTTMQVSYFGNPTSYYWDFGDPSTGISNFSTDSLGVHAFSAVGVYLVTLVVSDGMRTDTFYTVQDIIDCDIYPGNANRDGEVNMEDLFAIGISFGDTGTSRSTTSLSWAPQTCADWSSGNFMGNMYVQRLVDKKNADCNGDGSIGLHDVDAVNLNYGNHVPHYAHNDLMMPLQVRVTDPVLEVNPGVFNYLANDTVTLSIDLSALDSVWNVYGIAATIHYDPNHIVPGTMSISFGNGWLGTSGNDMFGLYKDFYADGYIEFGMVRNNKMNANGNGAIATLQFVLNGNTGSMAFEVDPLVKMISIGMFSSQEIFTPVNVSTNSIQAVITGVDDFTLSPMVLYPNPAQDKFVVSLRDGNSSGEWYLLDAVGKIVSHGIQSNESVHSFSISTDDLPAGVYSFSFHSNGKQFQKALTIVK